MKTLALTLSNEARSNELKVTTTYVNVNLVFEDIYDDIDIVIPEDEFDAFNAMLKQGNLKAVANTRIKITAPMSLNNVTAVRAALRKRSEAGDEIYSHYNFCK
jgi:hypothetical protein